MLIKTKKEKIISAVAKFVPNMLLTDKRLKMNSRNDIFHTNVNLYANNSLRFRKGTSGPWLGNGSTPSHLQPPDTPTNPQLRSICLQVNCGETASAYTESTTLHGLKYVGDSGLHIFERLFWTITFIMGILGAAYYISSLYQRWNDSPMIVSVSPTPTLLEAIPFPAITLCNMNGARKSVADPIVQNNSTAPRTLLEKKLINDLCGGPPENSPKVRANWTVIQKFLVKVSQPCHDMLIACKWRSQHIPCNDIFNPELTDEGMCCSFNKVNRSFIYRNPKELTDIMNYTFPYPGIDWTPEKGYPPGTPVDTNPWRAWGPGRSKGLTLVLDAQVAEYFCSSTASIGFKIMLHNPVEAPKMSDMAYFITPGVETRVEIIPKISTATPNLGNIPLEKRLCLFQHERELQFYRTYTQRNCQLECQSNFTLNQCSCVPFYLPKDFNTRTCGTTDEECVDQAKVTMDEEQLLKLVNVSSDESSTLQCACLPSCVTIEYTKQMSGSKLEDSFSVKSDYLMDRDLSYYKENMAVVHFFFVDNTFTGMEKGEIFGFTEFLSNTGGLLGLFLGFSIMSAAEIFYFVSLRMVCSWWRGRKLKRRRSAPQSHWKTHPLPFTR